MRPRKLDHFKGFNFYVVEDRVAPAPARNEDDDDDDEEASGEGKEKPVKGETNGLDKWFEVRREVLPPDEDDERKREDPTWKVCLSWGSARNGADTLDRRSRWVGSGITRLPRGTSRMRLC